MTDEEKKDQLIRLIVSLLQRLLVYESFVKWLQSEVGVSLSDIDQVLNSARVELENEKDLSGRLHTAVESSLQSAEVTLDSLLALALSQWKPKGKPN